MAKEITINLAHKTSKNFANSYIQLTSKIAMDRQKNIILTTSEKGSNTMGE
jgi:hypothetical protein